MNECSHCVEVERNLRRFMLAAADIMYATGGVDDDASMELASGMSIVVDDGDNDAGD